MNQQGRKRHSKQAVNLGYFSFCCGSADCSAGTEENTPLKPGAGGGRDAGEKPPAPTPRCAFAARLERTQRCARAPGCRPLEAASLWRLKGCLLLGLVAHIRWGAGRGGGDAGRRGRGPRRSGSAV